MMLKLNPPEGYPILEVQYDDVQILSVCFFYGSQELSWSKERSLEINRWTSASSMFPGTSVLLPGGELPTWRDVDSIIAADDGSPVATMAIDLLKKVAHYEETKRCTTRHSVTVSWREWWHDLQTTENRVAYLTYAADLSRTFRCIDQESTRNISEILPVKLAGHIASGSLESGFSDLENAANTSVESFIQLVGDLSSFVHSKKLLMSRNR